MKRGFSTKFNKPMTSIFPGEYYATEEDEVISTLLGSCVAIVLTDRIHKISGMNHFMLNGRMLKPGDNFTTSGKHALYATYKLIDQMLRLGAKSKNMHAKIFGGGKVLDTKDPVFNIHFENIVAARVILETEDIPIVQKDTGGSYTRKLFLDSREGTVYLHKSIKESIAELVV